MPVPRQSRAGFLVFLLAASLHAEVKVLKNFTLIDGTGKAPASSSAMIVKDGRIQWVGPVARLKSPASAETIDISGKYVMPGIINLHGHIGNTIDLDQNAKNFTRANVEKNLHTYAQYGVTTVLSMGTDQDLIFQIRDEQRAGRPSVARIYTAGQGFVFKGGYGGLAGVTPQVASASEVRSLVDAQAKKKVDIVKLWMDDHLGKFPKMPYDIANEIIADSHKDHLRTAAHIFYLQDAKDLTGHGVDGLAHSVRDKPVDQELISSMKKHGTWQLASTLTREASMFVYGSTPSFAIDPFFTRAVSTKVLSLLKSPQYQDKIKADPDFKEYRAFFETAKHNLKALADAGVKYGMGTDTGPPGRFPGYFEHWEMQLMVEAGLTPMQVITAATRSGAEFLRAKDLGTLEQGKWADLLVLDNNPLDKITNTRTIQAVYIAGNEVKR